jgi:hypothetical protein
MRLKNQSTCLHVMYLTLACALSATAGPLFPCVKAVSSKNGNFLVLTDVQLDPRLGGVQGVSLLVYQKENFINQKDRLTVPARYWTDGQRWSVVLEADRKHNEPHPCPLPLVTDDGEFLVLLHVGPTISADAGVLQIYRRRDHTGDPIREGPDHGVFIKEIGLNRIWTPDKLAANVGAWNDETPQWFAGGIFEFSSNNRQLIHITRWGKTVRINLADGSLADK